MTVKNIELPFEKINNIVHIADVHIRNYKRHREYRQVFRKLYKKLRSTPKETLIYVGGDIVHTKTDISPELVQMVSDFFNTLANIRPTIVITGNHDANLNNKSRMDSLTPIVKNLDNPNLHYLKDSGVYVLGDCAFTVMSVFDDPSEYLKSSASPKGKTKIALYHGTVHNSETDIGYVVDNLDVELKKFTGYDYVMLGDIHKQQYLNKSKTVAYSGSLIQQNFGESFKRHGIIIWNLLEKTSEFIEIENDYGYYTVEVKNGKPINLSDIPPKPRLRVRTENTTVADVKKIVIDLKKKYKVQDVIVLRSDKLSDKKNPYSNGLELTKNVRSAECQNDLLKEYLDKRFDIDDEMLKRIQTINRELNKYLQEIDISRNISWKPKMFEFSNMFSYGDGNIVNFENMKGSIGAFAANHSGKSALLDAVSFCIFDRCSRSRHGMDVMNNKKKTFYCKLNFEIEGIDYFIERRGKRFKNGGVRVDTDFWMIDEANEKISLNGEQRRDTNKNIQGYLGTYEDFTLTALSVQNNNTGFIEKTQTEKKDLLAQFLDITVFEELYQLANEEIRDVQALLKDFKNTDFETELVECESNHEKINLLYTEKTAELDNLKKQLKKLNDKVVQKNKKLITISTPPLTLESLDAKLISLTTEISENVSKLEKYDKYTNENKSEFLNITNSLKKISEQDILENKNKYDLDIQKRDKLNIDLDKLKLIITNKLDKLKAIGQFDPNCDFCKNTPFVKSAFEIEKTLLLDKQNAIHIKNQLSSLGEILENSTATAEYDNMISLKERINTIKQYQNEIKLKRAQREIKISNIKNSIKDCESQIQIYHDNKKSIKYNDKLHSEITKIEHEITSKELEISAHNTNLRTTYSELMVLQNRIQSIKNSIAKADELEKRSNAYEYYLNAISRDGIPYELISNIIPHIEDEVNLILSQIVDFRIVFHIDGKNINTHIAYDNDNTWPLELTSGMEKFISSLAIRVALINISNLPRPNFLAIDEGFGNLDTTSLNSIFMLFGYLKTEFDFLFIISHIDVMKDIMDDLVEISVERGYSKVNY